MSPTTQDDGEKLQDLVEQLSEAAKGYDASPGAAGYISRTSVSQVAKEIVRLMMAPSDMSMHHAANVSVKIVYFHETGTELHTSSSRSQPPPFRCSRSWRYAPCCHWACSKRSPKQVRYHWQISRPPPMSRTRFWKDNFECSSARASSTRRQTTSTCTPNSPKPTFRYRDLATFSNSCKSVFPLILCHSS